MKKITPSIFLSLFCFITISPEGFSSGTLIKTPFKQVRIENLSAGDIVISRTKASFTTNKELKYDE